MRKVKNFNRKITALNTADEFKDMILAELEKLRVSLKEKYVHKYYNLLGEKHELKTQFISNCIFDGNPADQSFALKQAIIIAEETDFFLSELENKYFDQILFKSLKALPTVNLQIIDVINSMVPDSLTIKKLLNASAKAISEINKGNKPFLFILLDFNESLLEIYNSSEEGLMKHFCRLNAEVINEYATQTIHELREKTFDAQRNKYDLDSHLQELSEILKGEFDLLKSISKPIDFSMLLTTGTSKNDSLIDCNNKINENVVDTISVEVVPGSSAQEVVSFLPKQADFRGHAKSPVQYSDIRNPLIFSKFEQELFDSEIIDADYNFQKKKGNLKMLAALYKILIQLNYFRKKNYKNGRDFDFCHYRQYLDYRYNIDTSQQFRKCSPKDIAGFKYSHTWIDNIEYCR